MDATIKTQWRTMTPSDSALHYRCWFGILQEDMSKSLCPHSASTYFILWCKSWVTVVGLGKVINTWRLSAVGKSIDSLSQCISGHCIKSFNMKGTIKIKTVHIHITKRTYRQSFSWILMNAKWPISKKNVNLKNNKRDTDLHTFVLLFSVFVGETSHERRNENLSC